MAEKNSQNWFFKFFPGLKDEAFSKMLATFDLWQEKTFKKGEVIFHEGDLSTEFYLLIKGKVEIAKIVNLEKNLKKILAVLHEGDFFGEGALLSEKPRSATALSLQDTTLLMLGKEKFDHLLKEHPKSALVLLSAILNVVNERLQAANTELVILYEVSRIISGAKRDLSFLGKKILEKIGVVTGSDQGILGLKNIATGKEEVLALFNFAEKKKAEELLNQGKEIIDSLEKQEEVSFHSQGKELLIPLFNLEKKFLGVILLLKRDQFSEDQIKLALTVGEELGAVIGDFKKCESEQEKVKLKQKIYQF